MTYLPHWRFRIEGVLGYIPGTGTSYGWDETFSTGINIGAMGLVDEDPGHGVGVPPVALPDDGSGISPELQWLKGKGQAFANGLFQAFTTDSARVTSLKLNKIGPDGKYADDTTTHELLDHDFTAPIVGSGHNYLPPQIAEVVTLHTDVMRGHAARGRMFLPAPSYALDSTGQVVPADQTTRIAQLRAIFHNVTGPAASGATLVGPIVVSGIGLGVNRPVRTVAVGRVLDTMRSRRRSLSEGYLVSVPI